MRGAHIRALMLSVIMLSGMLLVSIGVDGVFAEKGGKKKAQGDPEGCDKGQAEAQNPNCLNSNDSSTCDNDQDGDGICDAEDRCPGDPVGPEGQSNGDYDGDGIPNGKDQFPCKAPLP